MSTSFFFIVFFWVARLTTIYSEILAGNANKMGLPPFLVLILELRRALAQDVRGAHIRWHLSSRGPVCQALHDVAGLIHFGARHPKRYLASEVFHELWVSRDSEPRSAVRAPSARSTPRAASLRALRCRHVACGSAKRSDGLLLHVGMHLWPPAWE